jgi:glycosyltransferase involved in cell wall biosynthesis
MKIVQVTSLFSSVHGGSAEVPYYLSRELAKKEHDITIYTSSFKLRHITPIPKVKLHIFKAWLSVFGFNVTPGIIKRAKEEIRHLDIIHMHNYRTFQNVVVHHYAKKSGVPFVLQAHGSLTTFFQKGWLKRAFDAVWGRHILKDAAKFIAVTRTEAEQYKSMGVSGDRIEIIPNGVDLSEFDNLPRKGEFRKKYGLPDDQRIVLFLGRINKIKGLDLLARAFADLSGSLKDLRLVIVGPDDGYLSSLKKLVAALGISDRVLFSGPLYGREKLEAYVDAEVYVLPSTYEIFGITILEACACGTPVIMTDRCGITDIIKGQAGFVVPFNKDQLRDALLHMLGDDKMRRDFGERGKSLVHERFSWEKIAEQLEKLYHDQVLSSR